MPESQLTIRELHTPDEARQVEDLQRIAWEMRAERDVVPAHVLITAAENGGLLLGAFDGPALIGIVFGFLGRAPDGRWKHCSHLLGVLPAYRGRGIGALLKLRQRELVLAQGLDLITWTYDPLLSPNARLNIAKLGTVCNTYLCDVYGELDDELNRGLPTDRFQVDWWLRDTRNRVANERGDPPVANVVELEDGVPVPGAWTLPAALGFRVEIPADFQVLRRTAPSVARAWRDTTRALFEAAFASGYTVVDFALAAQDGRRRGYYLLERTDAHRPS